MTGWKTIEQTAAILSYVMEHLLASADIYSGGEWDKQRIKALDESYLRAIGWVEKKLGPEPVF